MRQDYISIIGIFGKFVLLSNGAHESNKGSSYKHVRCFSIFLGYGHFYGSVICSCVPVQEVLETAIFGLNASQELQNSKYSRGFKYRRFNGITYTARFDINNCLKPI